MARTPSRPERERPQESQGNDRKLSVWLFVGAGSIMILYSLGAVFSTETGLLALFRYKLAARDLTAEKHSLEHTIADEKKELRDLARDPYGLERIARERQHRIRPGEVLVLPDSKNLLSRD